MICFLKKLVKSVSFYISCYNIAGTEESQGYAISTGKAIAMTAVDLFLNTDLVTQIKAEFQQISTQAQQETAAK